MSRISVMGSGWLGWPLAAELVSQGHQVCLSTTSEQRLAELERTGARALLVDIEQPGDSLETLLQSQMLVINITSKNIDAFAGLARMIEASAVEHVLFVSSTSVYRNVNRTVTEQGGDESPDSPLFVIENLLRECDGFDTTVIRFAGLVGGRRHPGRFFRKLGRVQQPDAPVNLIHRRDCLNIIERIIDSDIRGEVFNGCADSHPSKREFYTAAARSIGQPPPEFIDSDEAAYKIIGNDKVKRVLNYSFVYPDMMQMLADPAAFAGDER